MNIKYSLFFNRIDLIIVIEITRLRASIWPCFIYILTYQWGKFVMIWHTPKVAEIAVGLEINSYACAEV